MKNLLLIFTLLFTSVFFSSPSYAEWTKVSSSGGGVKTFYVDFERIRKHDGFVYWWDLEDLLKPNKEGFLSSKVYNQGDCKLFQFKRLSFSYHNEPMSGGTAETHNPKNPEWVYPPPESIMETILKTVCNR